MFGVGLAGGGDIYVALLGYCLLLSIGLKLGAAFARSRGWQDWPVPKLRFLWPFITLAIIVLSIALIVAMAWLRPAAIVGQTVAFVCLIFCVAAVFFFVVNSSGRRVGMTLRRLAAIATLAVISIALSVGLCTLYLMAKYTFLIGLFLLAIYTSRIR